MAPRSLYMDEVAPSRGIQRHDLKKDDIWPERTDAHVGGLREGFALAVCIGCKPSVYVVIGWAVKSRQPGRPLRGLVYPFD